jgi:O-antigen/teichoic acid export membrane protein
MSLAQKGLSGFIYTFSSSVLNKIIAFVGGIFIARILYPEDYGLVGMLYIIFEVTNFMISGGFGLALIREKKISEADKATVFYFNIIVSTVIYVLLWFGAPLIASFYERQELIILTRIMGLNLLFGSLLIVQTSILQRELKFKFLGILEIISGLIVTLIAVILAYKGFGVYALAIKFILGSLISSIFIFIFNPWLPKGFINKKSFKRLFAFSSNVMLLGLLNSVFRNLNQVIIGKYFSAAAVGFFNQGNMLKNQVTATLNQTIIKVTFPMLSQLQEDKERLKGAYMRIVRINSFTILPAVTILILTAEPLIISLLGEKWRGSIIFLQILGISGYVSHLHGINLNVLKVYGKGRDYLYQGFFRNGITALGILITVNISAVAMAWAYAIGEFLQLFINVYYSNKYIKFSFSEQLKIMLPLILITAVMGVSVYMIGLYNYDWNPLKLIIMPISGILIYLSLCVFFKIEAFLDFKSLISSKIFNKPK